MCTLEGVCRRRDKQIARELQNEKKSWMYHTYGRPQTIPMREQTHQVCRVHAMEVPVGSEDVYEQVCKQECDHSRVLHAHEPPKQPFAVVLLCMNTTHCEIHQQTYLHSSVHIQSVMRSVRGRARSGWPLGAWRRDARKRAGDELGAQGEQGCLRLIGGIEAGRTHKQAGEWEEQTKSWGHRGSKVSSRGRT